MFLRIEDANFALFNYVTEMNNQVETLQDSIAKLKQDIKEARERGEEKERQQTIFRFKIFVKWLSTNPMTPVEKAKAIDMFDFYHFTAEDLASSVWESGLYSGDKIIERMKQISDEKQRGIEYMKEQLDDLEQEKKEALSEKDREINKLRNEASIRVQLSDIPPIHM